MSVFFVIHSPVVYTCKHIAYADPVRRSACVPLNKQRPIIKTNIIETAMVTPISTKLVTYNQYI